MGTTMFPRFIWVQRGMNAAVDYGCAAGACLPSDRITAKRIAGVNPDADDVAGLDVPGHERFERLVNDPRVTERVRRRRGEYVQPARRDYGDAEGHIAWIDE